MASMAASAQTGLFCLLRLLALVRNAEVAADPSCTGQRDTSRKTGVTGNKVYRASGVALALAWAFTAAWFLLGVDMVLYSPGNPGKGGTAGVVAGAIIGILAILGSLVGGAAIATNRIIVTSAGLAYKNGLRGRQFGWPEIESFAVGPGRSILGWPTLIIRLGDGSSVVTHVSSFTARHPTLVARELAALQAEAGAASVAGRDMATGEAD